MALDKNIALLQKYWPRNKAKGLLAQSVFYSETAKEKLFPGCWLISPKEENFYRYRFAVFVHPQPVISNRTLTEPKDILGDFYRPLNAVAEFMTNAGIGIAYAYAATLDGKIPLDQLAEKNFEGIDWKLFLYQNSRFIQHNPTNFFSQWPGDRGRPSHGTPWDDEVKRKIALLSPDTLNEMLLNELFISGFLKSVLKKPLTDPYDVDSFIISLSQKYVFPVEIKEKFAGQNRQEKFFGIDAGRIMMLLRLCLPNDTNAIYLIRELSQQGKFIDWKYITLTDIVMTASWNLQAGGPGMGGQNTQTVKLPYKHFKTFNASAMSEENLRKIGKIPEDIKIAAREFGNDIETRFYANP